MRTRDYLHASAKKCYQTLNKLKGGGVQLAGDAPSLDGPVSDDQFIEVAERSLTSALRLMAVCSEHLGFHIWLPVWAEIQLHRF